jgi:hypothetical protein
MVVSRLTRELPRRTGVGHANLRRQNDAMTEELTKTEARQGDRRRMNMTVLIAGTAAIVVIFAVMYAIWA